MRALLAGATGLVGGHLARQLPAEGLVLVGRREAAGLDPAVKQLIGPPGDWPELMAGQQVDVAFCTLGTTIRQAGSKDAFAAIDRDAVASFARAARDAGAAHFLLVSSVGASARSSNFYLKTKGEAENEVAACGFRRVDIFRPGLLRGERQGPSRVGEAIAMALSPVTDFLTPASFDRYRSIEARAVAAAMAAMAKAETPGVHIHQNREILAAAKF